MSYVSIPLQSSDSGIKNINNNSDVVVDRDKNKNNENSEIKKKEKININNIKSRFDVNPESTASFLSKRTFYFLNPLMSKGVKEPLKYEDIYPIMHRDKSSTVYPIFRRIWNPKPMNDNDNSELYQNFSSNVQSKKALNSAFGFSFHMAFFLKLFNDLSEFVFPIIIYYLVEFVQDPNQSIWWGILYTTILLLAYMTSALLSTSWDYYVSIIAYKVRTSLINAVYEKSLNISNFVREKDNKGKGNTINLMSVDVDMIKELFEYGHYILSIPVQLIVSFILLYKLLGNSVLIGYATLLIFIPLNLKAAMVEASVTERVMKHKDARTSKITESIHSIRVLKFYGWVNLMYEKIQSLRATEFKELRLLKIVDAMLYLLWVIVPDIVSVTTYTAYALFGNQLQISTIISSLSVFMLMRFPLSLLPHIMAGVTLSFVSIGRIEKFLLNEELEKPKRTEGGSYYFGKVDNGFDKSNLAISFKDSSFKYVTVDDGGEDEEGKEKEKESMKEKLNEGFDKMPADIEKDPEILKNISLVFPKGSFTTIIGPVASGKSSILSAILGDMTITKGNLSRKGTISYVSQIPWIMNGTLRDNILFGNEYNEEKYQKIIRDCCLEQDLDILPSGDLCEIGERGINLSGGQKMRVSIARSLYTDADIYLFDDPLASLDVGVSHKLFHQALRTLVPAKTVILVTHQLFPLEHSTNIVQVKDGTIEKVGTYDSFPQESWDIFKFEQEKSTEEKEKEEKDDEDEDDEDDDDSEDGGLIGDEERNVGTIKIQHYITYIKNIGRLFFALTIIMSIANQIFSAFGSYWIAKWSEEWGNTNHLSLGFYLGIFCLSSVLMGLTIFLEKLSVNFGGLSASQAFHNKALYKVLRSPIQFFDQNLSGRIINRFSKDISKMDNGIPQSFGESLDSFFAVISIMVIVAIASPMTLILLVPLLIYFYYLKNWFLNNQREIQRISSVSSSPVITHFSETLSGQQVIRAFHASERFMDQNMRKLDFNTSVELLEYFVSNWATFRLELGCSILVVATALSATFLRHWISPAFIGLALSYSVTMAGELNWMFHVWTNLETQMNSVERLQHYCELKEEAPDRIPSVNLPSSWPARGQVEFINYSMKYREELDPSLRNINLLIRPGSKVGIAGRTGAGKSSLLQSLFRLVEGSQGSIVIDGYDIAKIGLMDLRSKLSIIPQDPVLFAGSLRYNLDPFKQFSDSDIWEVLERVHLKDMVSSLDCTVSEDGSNFSVGQRQLMCLGRALLRKSKIIALDEATAAVDMETDKFIQNTIKEEFKNSTVITIAHRLNTIMDYDVVVLMSEGTVKQVGKPSEILLLHNNSSENLSEQQSQHQHIATNEESLI
eukprot:gene4289-5364_t